MAQIVQLPLKSYRKPEQRPAPIMQDPERKCRPQSRPLSKISNRNEFIKQANPDYTVNAVPCYIELCCE